MKWSLPNLAWACSRGSYFGANLGDYHPAVSVWNCKYNPHKHNTEILYVRFYFYYTLAGDRDSSVGTATRYGLEGPGIESSWGRGEIFRNCPDRPWGPPSLL